MAAQSVRAEGRGGQSEQLVAFRLPSLTITSIIADDLLHRGRVSACITPSHPLSQSAKLKMPQTVSPANATVKAEPSDCGDEDLLRIDLAAESDKDFRNSLIPLAGLCPIDEPYWTNHSDIFTARGCQALTIRYMSTEGMLPSIEDIADKIRAAIWRKISGLTYKDGAPPPFPSIVFDESSMPDHDGMGVIDLVFPSLKEYGSAYKSIVRDLHSIEIAGVEGDKTHVYEYACSTNSLDGSIIVIECLRLPIDSLDAKAVFAALNTMVQPLGSVLGLCKIGVGSKTWGISKQDSGIVRFYLQLTPEKMATSWEHSIVPLLPTHFVCNGVPYTLRYYGVELHKKKSFSTNFDIVFHDSRIPPEASSSSLDKRPREASDAAESSSSAAKKARYGTQQTA